MLPLLMDLPVPLPQEPHEERPRPINLRQADRQHLTPLRLLRRDPPPKINIYQLDKPVLQTPTERGEHLLQKEVTLLAEIPERRGQENAGGAGRGLGHTECHDSSYTDRWPSYGLDLLKAI